MAQTANQRLFDMLVRHSVGLERLKAGLIKELLVLLEEVEVDLIRQLRELNPRSFRAVHLRQILADTRGRRIAAYTRLKELLIDELDELAKYEGTFLVEGFKRATPLAAVISLPSNETLIAAARTHMRGDLLGGWLKDASESSIRRVTRAVRIGIAEGESIPQILTRTGAESRRDIIEMTAIIRTSVSHVTTQAREEVYKANRKYIKQLMWRSVLDNRTTAICMSRDGETYPIDDGPRPPAHINCRSIMVPITRTWDELAPSARDALGDLPPAQRSALGGPVPTDMNYGEWIRTQPIAIQEDALGKTRAALFRSGRIELNAFIDPTGRFYTLDELRRKERFKALFEDLDL